MLMIPNMENKEIQCLNTSSEQMWKEAGGTFFSKIQAKVPKEDLLLIWDRK